MTNVAKKFECKGWIINNEKDYLKKKNLIPLKKNILLLRSENLGNSFIK